MQEYNKKESKANAMTRDGVSHFKARAPACSFHRKETAFGLEYYSYTHFLHFHILNMEHSMEREAASVSESEQVYPFAGIYWFHFLSLPSSCSVRARARELSFWKTAKSIKPKESCKIHISKCKHNSWKLKWFLMLFGCVCVCVCLFGGKTMGDEKRKHETN